MVLLGLWWTFLFPVVPAPPGDVELWKAAMIAKTIKYSSWNTKALPSESSNFVIGIVGSDPFDGHLPDVFKNNEIAGKPVVVRIVTSLDDARGCQVLFVPEGKLPLWQDMTKGGGAGATALKGVLTIGEDNAFLDSGGLIQLRLVERKFVYEPANVRASGLNIDPRFLNIGIKRNTITAGER